MLQQKNPSVEFFFKKNLGCKLALLMYTFQDNAGLLLQYIPLKEEITNFDCSTT